MEDADTEPAHHADPLVGTVLSAKWRVLRRVGEGGMATVYECQHALLGTRAAAKVLAPELALRPDVVRRFHEEGRVVGRIRHVGVPRVFDIGSTSDGRPFLLMEFLDGQTVEAERIQNGGQLAPARVAAIASALLEVVAAAHEASLVHRDIKPQNVFVLKTGEIKLVDFGIARVRELASGTGRTQAGVFVGTPGYAAPEQVHGHQHLLGVPTDVWGVGATLYALLLGRPPADGADRELAQVRHPVASTISRALSPSPGDRWQSATQMRLSLAALDPTEPGNGLVAQQNAAARHVDPPVPRQHGKNDPVQAQVKRDWKAGELRDLCVEAVRATKREFIIPLGAFAMSVVVTIAAWSVVWSLGLFVLSCGCVGALRTAVRLWNRIGEGGVYVQWLERCPSNEELADSPMRRECERFIEKPRRKS